MTGDQVNATKEFADLPPELRTPVPGPRSRDWAQRLSRVECPDTTYLAADFPVFWERALGANVWDVDDNRFVDLTAAFGVCSLGHAHPRLVAVMQQQAARLPHGMGDVHPTACKVQLAERLAAVAPGDLSISLFGVTGSDAVEAALKTALLHTGRSGVIAFGGAYHGLGYGALATTWRAHFRGAFQEQLNPHVRHLTYPHPHHRPRRGTSSADEAALALQDVERLLSSGAGTTIGAILVEPIQGRGGVVMPHASFLQGLRDLARRHGRVLFFDEIFSGLGRTGSWFACEQVDVVPDLLCVGKSLGGGLPLSVCIGTPEVMSGWGRSCGEAVHTSTFLGHPMACATALVQLQLLEDEDGPQQARALGDRLQQRLHLLRDVPGVADIRGRGAMWGIELENEGQPDAPRVAAIITGALQRGYLLLAAGDAGNVIQLTPPFVLGETQLDGFFDVLQTLLFTTGPGMRLA
jgi:4-aminobutyrate aminotransferase-like enzyme